jgi:hypothetical protein
MSYVFVQLSHDYADEFDVDCCFVQSKQEFESDLEKIKEGFEDGTLVDKKFYFGTNEALTFEEYEDFVGGIEVDDCSQEFFEEFTRLAGGCVGFCVMDGLLEEVE